MKTIKFTTNKHLSFTEKRIIFMSEKDNHRDDKSDANLRENQGESKEKPDQKPIDEIREEGGDKIVDIIDNPNTPGSPDDQITTHEWSIAGEGELAKAIEREVTYNVSTNIDGDSGDTKVNIEHIGPTAEITGPSTVTENQITAFDSSKSTTVDGYVLIESKWMINGDGVIVGPDNGETVQVQANNKAGANGSFTLTLQVRDKDGNWSVPNVKFVTVERYKED